MTTQEHIDELMAASEPHFVDMYPPLTSRIRRLIPILAAESLYYALLVGFRSEAVQTATFAQGRFDLATVNKLRAAANMYQLCEAENEVVTKLKFGWHNLGLAGDMVEDGDPLKRGVQWSWKNAKDYYKFDLQVIKIPDLESGGLWKSFVDTPHVQLTMGLSLEDAIVLYKAGGKDAVWAEMDKRIQSAGSSGFDPETPAIV